MIALDHFGQENFNHEINDSFHYFYDKGDDNWIRLYRDFNKFKWLPQSKFFQPSFWLF